ncbi:hypothetical protein LA080_016120 [Diaporthe eres]|nr:hypothetical protein LA080_016120 [Diaporthe eres]
MVYRLDFKVDGGCRGNGQPDALGAAACCLEYGNSYRSKTCRLDNDYTAPTSQRAEITAVIPALEWALERYDELESYPRLEVNIRSGSRYAVDCMTNWVHTWVRNGWTNSRGLEVANRDLIERPSDLDDRASELGSINYIWIPRSDNEVADALCQQELDEQEENYGNYGFISLL